MPGTSDRSFSGLAVKLSAETADLRERRSARSLGDIRGESLGRL